MAASKAHHAVSERAIWVVIYPENKDAAVLDSEFTMNTVQDNIVPG